MAKSKNEHLQEQIAQLTELVGKLSGEVAELRAQKTATEPVDVGELPPLQVFSTRGKPRSNVAYSLLGIPPQGCGLQPQAVKVCILLSKAADPMNISEQEAMAIFNTEKARAFLDTRQKPWRIMQYYKSQLIKRDFLRMKQ